MSTQSDIRDVVRNHYAGMATGRQSCCGTEATCCGEDVSQKIGYSPEELASLPEGAEMGLGCGNPIAFARLRPGETVVDLGSGGGIDCFLAAKIVGETGKVIGVDMTPEMLSKARRNAAENGFSNVEFRLGEIEHLPLGDNSADAVISNCVINLSPDKRQVYREAFRVLKSGGRLTVADMVAIAPIPEFLRNDVAAYTGCVAGAANGQEIESWLREAGFTRIEIRIRRKSSEFIQADAGSGKLDDYVASADVVSWKP